MHKLDQVGGRGLLGHDGKYPACPSQLLCSASVTLVSRVVEYGWMAENLEIVASAANGAEAELVRQRLLSEGIHAISERTIGSAEWGSSGARNVYVAEADADRARAALAESPLSDEELARLSEEAGREPTGH